MSHKAHEGYSGKNPVPKVALKSIFNNRAATESKAKTVGRDKEQDSKSGTSDGILKGAEVQVKDPVTGEETTVKHAEEIHGDEEQGTSVLTMNLLPPEWSSYRSLTIHLIRDAFLKIMAAFTLSPIVAYVMLYYNPLLSWSTLADRWQGTIYLILSLAPPLLFSYCLLFSVQSKASQEYDSRAWDSERQRGLTAGEDSNRDGRVSADERVKESAEWLNATLRYIWPIINMDLFTSCVDLLEDVMQASVPQFVQSVRISDMGQGSQPMRILYVRSLPDVDVTDVMEAVEDNTKERLKREHVNVEIAFAHQALPSGMSVSSKAQNPHLLIDFFLGLRGVWGFRIPIWVELLGATGVARARLELIPDPPFIKTALVTFMGLPRVNISVVPMAKSLPNVMNLPVISDFISKSIDTACAEYVAPKSITLDLQQLISGDDIKKDTQAIGVVVVHIHRATGIKKMDTTGSADPYVTVTFSKQGKPLYSTRIIERELDPVFEETTVVLVDTNAIKVHERLCLQLWDSDRGSVDDMMGFVEVELLELIRNKNSALRRTTPFKSPDSEERPGSIEFTVGFYSKAHPNQALSTDGMDPSIPDDLKDEPEFKEDRAVALNSLEESILVTPPDPELPSGILSVQIHEIRGLAMRTDRKEDDIDEAEEQEEGEHLPSSYCTIAINDDLIYATRVKPITSTPMFNAGTEQFMPDWRAGHVSVVVRDSRMREHDPILGMVFLKLSEILKNASVVTKFFPLEGGIGFGSARISILFRPVRARLAQHLIGFHTGTVEIRDIRMRKDRIQDYQHISHCDMKLKACSSVARLKTKESHDAEVIVWGADQGSVRLPVRSRYSSSLVISLKDTSIIGSKKVGLGVMWLQDLVDNEEQQIDVVLWTADGSDYNRIKRNYTPPNGNLEMLDGKTTGLKRLGVLTITLSFLAGMTDAHERVIKSSSGPSRRQTVEEAKRRRSITDNNTVGTISKENASKSDSIHIDQNTNTEVGRDQMEILDSPDDDSNSSQDEDEERSESSGESGNEGLMAKLKQWRQHERELHEQHRGIMQRKPARTAAWIKDNIEDAGHAVKDRFTMKTRQPELETEA